jgi:hypothetical protein
MLKSKAINLVMLPSPEAPDDYKSRVIRYETEDVVNHKGETYAIIKEQSQVQFIELTKLELVEFIANKKEDE